MPLMVVSGFVAGLSVLLLIPLLQLVGVGDADGAGDRLTELLASTAATVGIPVTLPVVLGLFVVIAIAEGLLSRWEILISTAIQQEFVARLRTRMYAAIAHADWIFVSRRRASDLTHVVTEEVGRVGMMVHELLRGTAAVAVVAIYLFLALQLSLPMTLVAVLSGAVLLLALHPATRRARVLGERVSRSVADLYTATSEHFGALKIAKGYGAEERHVHHFAQVSAGVAESYLEIVRNHSDRRFWFSVGTVILLSGLVFLAVEWMELRAATLLVFLFLFYRLMPRFSGLQQSFQFFLNAVPASERVEELLSAAEGSVPPSLQEDGEIRLQDEIRFEGVSFRYLQDDSAPAVEKLEMSIKGRQITALVGASGAGKSTIVDLLMGLLTPEEGRILIDGVRLERRLFQSWRSRLGYVAQETFFFHDTIRANLLWAHPQATEDELWNALRQASAFHFIARMPARLETVIGDRGVRLSGGERQRLALARALLRKPDLLILDEATSALDSVNERRVQEAIEKLHGTVTMLVVAHRLATLRRADMIYVIDRGRVVESGQWTELLARRGRFHELYMLQALDTEAIKGGMVEVE